MAAVSIIVPAYNAQKTIGRCIESILNQTYTDFELLVMDDGSKDETPEIIDRYAAKDARVIAVHKPNSGVSDTRNQALDRASGRYIQFLDADDWWEEGKLAAQLAALEMTGDVICSTGRDLMNPDGTFTGKYISVKSRLDYHELLKHNSINCSSVLILREVALEFPMEHDDSHEDYITWLQVVRKYGHATGINRPYLKYRLSQGGKSRNKAKSAIMTYQVYRYVGYGPLRSAFFFFSYAFHGIWKYR